MMMMRINITLTITNDDYGGDINDDDDENDDDDYV